ncbi:MULTISPECIES: immunoglobulin-like domain-containing protein [unclassified Breznakia]|uniref:immunoglobulin-like domain-containing protein n=1 Tax=unclassified Breznakia TaxID=2623764 RepID=UPI00247687A0|nr:MULTISPECIES: immunoglobulin-like domain-containing protein [unclassified Breznakia]MDH6367387.1 hypothetical protein [Breznakia sp. PH1-1]MDH6403919.1 hypothetical protein [Breznakia sp. PF1-11]MDH6411628.1 hypothetical protein [Breznakia sp. PFB1-11]MDH6414554.1 hypothetical protein [Breznakia sp. PFB1-14]MDH6418660.1 hypothetical protein [Breznakia sp. PFB1-12]
MTSKLNEKSAKKKIRQIALFFFICVSSGCSLLDTSPDINFAIKFKEKKSVAFGENVSSCSFVDYVGDYRIEDKHISKNENKIYISNLDVECGELNTKKLGKQTISYILGGKETTMEVTVKDLTAPKITIDEKFEIEEGTAFNLKEKVVVKDNVDKTKNVDVKIDGDFNKDKAGTYTLTVIAKDKAKNESKAKVTITVKEKQKEVPKETPKENKDNPIQNAGGNNNPQNDAGGSNVNGQTIVQPNIPSVSYTKKFLFSDGYNFQTAPEACQQEALSAYSQGHGATCTNLFDANGQPIGQLLTVK